MRPSRSASSDTIKVLYIAGYGRSGSTILGTLLGCGARFIHVGEIGFLAQEWLQTTGRCSCGERFPACEFWAECLAPEELDWLAHATPRIERLVRLPALILSRIDGPTEIRYGQTQRKVLRHAVKESGASVVVDGSKSAWATAGRPLALKKFARCDVYVLHLVRSARSIMRSVSTVPSNRALNGTVPPRRFTLLRALTGWIAANSAAYTVGRWGVGRRRYMQVRYRDLVAHPTETLRRISSFVAEDLDDTIRRVTGDAYLDVGHVVGGNRIRFAGRLKLRRRDTTARGKKVHRSLGTAGAGQRGDPATLPLSE